MPLKFAANLSFCFQEIPTLCARYAEASTAGFKFVECSFPYGEPMDKLSEARTMAGVQQVLINAWPGDLSAGDVGIAALPDRKQEFREKMEMSVEYAKALGCTRMHIMSGKVPENADNSTRTSMEDTYIDNITYAADRLNQDGITAFIEGVNSRLSVPRYFMDDPYRCLEYVKKINRPNLKLLFDVFHVQIMCGNLTANINRFLPYIGHIQIAQVPLRGEPDTDGEINYRYILKLLEESGYDGFIGLEYKPQGETVAGLKWLKTLGYEL